MDLYNFKDYKNAKSWFIRAKRVVEQIPEEAEIAYNICCEEIDFSILKNFPTLNNCELFINRYPNGRYHQEVGDKLAIF